MYILTSVYMRMHFQNEYSRWVVVSIYTLLRLMALYVYIITPGLDADQATIHYLNQWLSVYWRIYATLGVLITQ